jgi:hypothetical protein
MAVRVTCPNGHTLNLDEALAGKRVKCPRCQALVTVPGGAKETAVTAKQPAKVKAAARRKAEDDDDDEEEEEDERPRRKAAASSAKGLARDDDEEPLDPEERRKERLRDRRRRLRLVNTGLLLHLVKLWIYVVIVLSLVVNNVFMIVVNVVRDMAAADRDLSPDALALFAFLQLIFFFGIMIGVIIAPIVGTVGSGFCLMVPKKSEAKGTIITSFVFDVLPMVGSLIMILASLDVFGMDIESVDGKAKLERLNLYIMIGSGFFTLSAWFLFMVFLRQFGQYIGQPGLGNEALNLIAYLIVQVISLPITMIMTLYMFRLFIGLLGSFMGIIIMFIVVICWFAQFYFLFFVGMISLLNAMRAAVKEEI